MVNTDINVNRMAKTTFSNLQRNDKVLGEEKYNRKLRETKGEVPPDRQLSHDKLVASFQAFYDCTSKLADLLNFSMPKLRQLPSGR